MPAKFRIAERLQKLPPYLFAEIDKKKKAAIAAGRDVINLGIGDPDTPTPKFVIDALYRHAQNPATHQYALDNGSAELRGAAARWMKKRFGVELSPDGEVYPIIGSKEGIAHFPLAFINPGDAALVPEPGYPPYRSGTIFAGGEPVMMPLLAKNGFLPDLGAVKPASLKRAKLIYVNYPNNPTGAVADAEFYKELLAFARKHDLIVVSDTAYSELAFDGAEPMSMLAIPGARERVIEFHSFSKTFNMTGWRVGFAAGSAELCGALGRVKTNLDSGIFTAIQLASVEALEHYDEFIKPLRTMYQKRRDVFCDGLASLGWVPGLGSRVSDKEAGGRRGSPIPQTPEPRTLPFEKPKGAFYVWFPTPKGLKSADAATRALEEADIVLTPGIGFGPSGEGYLRAALTVPEKRLAEAAERIGRIRW